MQPRRLVEPFPTESVRDLLGLVRTMYAAAKGAQAGRAELTRLARIGEELSAALARAEEAAPGSAGHAEALRLADAAALRVGELVDALTPAEPLVKAARARVAGAKVALRRKTPER